MWLRRGCSRDALRCGGGCAPHCSSTVLHDTIHVLQQILHRAAVDSCNCAVSGALGCAWHRSAAETVHAHSLLQGPGRACISWPPCTWMGAEYTPLAAKAKFSAPPTTNCLELPAPFTSSQLCGEHVRHVSAQSGWR